MGEDTPLIRDMAKRIDDLEWVLLQVVEGVEQYARAGAEEKTAAIRLLRRAVNAREYLDS